MNHIKTIGVITQTALCLLLAGVAYAGWPGDLIPKCSPDSVKTGSVCMDIYEASVWQIAPTNLAGKSNAGLIKKVKKGKATAADLAAGNATQRGAFNDDYPPTCPNTGQGCDDLYAVSLAGVLPAGDITWFQAQQACANSNKRLPSNAEWQMAVSGTPDPGSDNGSTDCNSNTGFTPTSTGSRTNCKSRWGTFDMVGNAYEWVADWVPLSQQICSTWGAFSSTLDDQCLVGADTSSTGGPGALIRGGGIEGNGAGPLTINGNIQPSYSDFEIGFRCAR